MNHGPHYDPDRRGGSLHLAVAPEVRFDTNFSLYFLSEGEGNLYRDLGWRPYPQEGWVVPLGGGSLARRPHAFLADASRAGAKAEGAALSPRSKRRISAFVNAGLNLAFPAYVGAKLALEGRYCDAFLLGLIYALLGFVFYEETS